MEKEAREALARTIASLEERLASSDQTQSRRTRKTAKPESPRARLLAQIDTLERQAGYMDDEMESACGVSMMDDDIELDEDIYEDDAMMDEDSDISMMDLDDDDDDDDDDLVGAPVVLDVEDDTFLASEEDPFGVEEEITQDYLDDVAEEEVNPDKITTNPTMLSTAPTGYVARLKSASARLDRVANVLETQGRNELAFRIDTIADAIDARIAKEVSNA